MDGRRSPQGPAARAAASIAELLAQDALVQAVAGVVHHDEVERAVDRDLDRDDVVDLGVIGDGADRTQGELARRFSACDQRCYARSA